jgi:hypothetical protein
LLAVIVFRDYAKIFQKFMGISWGQYINQVRYHIRTLREQNAILNALNEPDPALSKEILAQHEKMKI